MNRYNILIWGVALSYPLFATLIMFSASTELVQHIWLTCSLLLLLLISPSVLSRMRYLTKPAFYSCVLVATLVLLRLVCVPFFDLGFAWQMPTILHLAFVLCFMLSGQSMHGFRLERTPDYLYRTVNWRALSTALKWAMGFMLLGAAALLLTLQQLVPATAATQLMAHQFLIDMTLNSLFAVVLLDLLRLRSPAGAQSVESAKVSA